MRIIAGTARSRVIEAPKGRDTRPTLDRVRENLFNILQHRVPGARTLDLFGGSGAITLEAVSRGADKAVLADRDRAAIAAQRHNVKALGFEDKIRILESPWQATLRRLGEEKALFDLIFLDPPYAMEGVDQVMDALLPLMAEGALVILEHEARVTPAASEAFELTDRRKWGYVGVSFFRRKE